MIEHAAHRETPDGRLHVVWGALLIAARASQTRPHRKWALTISTRPLIGSGRARV